MRYIDVFNGDADGICALHQLRLADPLDSQLVTGLKREIALLERVDAHENDVVTVLDVSLDRNREALVRLLDAGAVVRYFDHHYAGAIPAHPNLEVMIDPTGGACTSALVDRHLWGRFRLWAIVGAFGDGLPEIAATLAKPFALSAVVLEDLRDLGETLNYNAYGEVPSEVIMPPLELYRLVHRYEDPLELLHAEPMVAKMSYERKEDLDRALELSPMRSHADFDAYLLPDEAWSRRVVGTFANKLAVEDPRRTHVVLTPVSEGYMVSVRSPLGARPSAVELCRRLGGGGRANAAGIDRLEPDRLDHFLDAVAGARAAVH